MKIFQEDFLNKEKIFFFDKKRDQAYFFLPENKGYIIDSNDNVIHFEYKINSKGILYFNFNNKNFTNYFWQLNAEMDSFIIINEISKNKENEIITDKDIKIDFDFVDDKIYKPINEKYSSNFKIFSNLDRQGKIYTILTYLAIFIILFFVLSNLYLVNQFNVLLKIIISILILVMSSDKIFKYLLKNNFYQKDK